MKESLKRGLNLASYRSAQFALSDVALWAKPEAQDRLIVHALAEIDPHPPVLLQRRRPIAPQNPGAYGAQSGFERQAAPFENPKNNHDEDGDSERPQTRMNQKQQDCGKRARIKREKTRRFLRIAPMNVHKRTLG
jgi:hypothetical protein